MFSDAPKDPEGKRVKETKIINAMFDKKGGKLVVNTSKPIFTEAIKHFNKDYGRKENTARPKLLKANEFADGMVGLDAAIKASCLHNVVLERWILHATHVLIVLFMYSKHVINTC